MSTPPALRRFMPSLLDRLTQDDRSDPAARRGDRLGDLNDLKASVKRDLEALLNARRPLDELPRGCDALASSLVNYGLPDLQSEEVRHSYDVGALCEMIRKCIERFEPRLRRVNVLPLDDFGAEARPFDRRFRFSIDAVLAAEPFVEEVQFTSTVEAGTSTIIVKEVS